MSLWSHEKHPFVYINNIFGAIAFLEGGDTFEGTAPTPEKGVWCSMLFGPDDLIGNPSAVGTKEAIECKEIHFSFGIKGMPTQPKEFHDKFFKYASNNGVRFKQIVHHLSFKSTTTDIIYTPYAKLEIHEAIVKAIGNNSYVMTFVEAKLDLFKVSEDGKTTTHSVTHLLKGVLQSSEPSKIAG